MKERDAEEQEEENPHIREKDEEWGERREGGRDREEAVEF